MAAQTTDLLTQRTATARAVGQLATASVATLATAAATAASTTVARPAVLATADAARRSALLGAHLTSTAGSFASNAFTSTLAVASLIGPSQLVAASCFGLATAAVRHARDLRLSRQRLQERCAREHKQRG